MLTAQRLMLTDDDRIASIRRRPAGGYMIFNDMGELLPVGRSYRAVARGLAARDGG